MTAALVAVAFVLSATPAFTQQLGEEDLLKLLVTEDEFDESWFSQDFRDVLLPSQLQAELTELLTGAGEFESLSGENGEYSLVFEEVMVTAQITLNEQGEIDTVLFDHPTPRLTDLAELKEQLLELPGETALLIEHNGEELVAHNADSQLGVASAFKLAVLASVIDETENGDLSSETVVAIEDEHRTLPSGILQDWPDGTPVTVEALLVKMMSLSDNTATDALMSLVGRDAIDRHNATPPTITTREFFVLTDPENADLAERWKDADDADQRAELLSETAEYDLPETAVFPDGPPDTDLGWRFSAEELAALAETAAGHEAASVNPGVASGTDWERIVYKDGYVPGVAAEVVHGVSETEAGEESYTAVLIWNEDEDDVRRMKLRGLAQSAVQILTER